MRDMGFLEMKRRVLPSLFHLFLFHFFLETFVVVSGLNVANLRQVSSLRLERIQRHLEKINKPAVMTIESPDGDIIDCVLRRKQPALDHPLLKNHKIQRVPLERPRVEMLVKGDGEVKDSKRRSNPVVEGAWQMWHTNGTRCPKGTIPVRRSTVHDVLRAKSLFDFGKKQHRPISLSRRTDAPDDVGSTGHEYAVAYVGTSQGVYGAKATINVWDPSVEAFGEFSLSQIWVVSGSYGTDLNTIEAGWQVFPGFYGDDSTRLFIYWTTVCKVACPRSYLDPVLGLDDNVNFTIVFRRDAFRSTGCYNLLCAGFVQINSKIAIGGAISPVSSYLGSQRAITIHIWQAPKQRVWWLSIDNNTVGYWPAELFTHLADRATIVEWGGEIVNSRANGRHTSTQMGSGHFPEGGFGNASFFRNLEIVDSNNSLISAQNIGLLAGNTNCYNINSSYNNEWGTYFYYGGPGYNPQCP